MLSVKQGSCDYQYWSSWFDLIWNQIAVFCSRGRCSISHLTQKKTNNKSTDQTNWQWWLTHVPSYCWWCIYCNLPDAANNWTNLNHRVKDITHCRHQITVSKLQKRCSKSSVWWNGRVMILCLVGKIRVLTRGTRNSLAGQVMTHEPPVAHPWLRAMLMLWWLPWNISAGEDFGFELGFADLVWVYYRDNAHCQISSKPCYLLMLYVMIRFFFNFNNRWQFLWINFYVGSFLLRSQRNCFKDLLCFS